MVSGVLFCLVFALCGILIPAVWANDCSSYVDSSGKQHNAKYCGFEECCGNCQNKYCCNDKTYSFSGSKQKLCEGSVAPCCFFYKKCRKGRNQRPRTARNTSTLVNELQQLHPPHGCQPYYPGYLPVPAQAGYGGLSFPSAPPSYLEATDPTYPPSGYTPGLPMVSYPGQPHAPTPHSDEFAPQPYNPSYGQNP
ncbi:protein shisa-4-like isoform X2 [Eleginops maclovinus]|uniref:protein shisa-4-like isoform X2 n=1 Tax=Eleginops maclovinus TaxID=56733 RepID=UPI003080A48F